jgi:subtilisin family serine protease
VDLRRLRAGEWLAAAGAVALVVSLFVDRDDGPVVDVLLAALAGLALLLGGLQATQASPAKPVGAGVLTVAFGLIGVVLVLFNGGVLALVSTVAITAGGWLSIAKERVRGLPPGPEPELRPSPRIADRAQP